MYNQLRLYGWQLLIVSFVAHLAAAADSISDCFPKKEHDFGSVPRGGILRMEFSIHNRLASDLVLSGTRATCGCTQVTLEQTNFRPGEKGNVVAKFDTRSLVGPRTGTLTILVEKPEATEIQLQYKGVVRGDIELTPGILDFGSVEQDTAAERRLTIHPLGNDNWRITAARCSQPFLVAELLPLKKIGNGQQCEVMVRLKSKEATGYFQDELVLTTNDTKLKTVTVSVVGRVEPAVSVSPEKLSLGSLVPGEALKRNLVLKGKTPFRVKSIHCETPGFQFDLNDEAKNLHTVPLRFVAPVQPGTITAEIIIVTDHPKFSELRCTATGTITDRLPP